MNEPVHLEANLFDVGNDTLRAHFQRFATSMAFESTNLAPGAWDTDCQEFPPDFVPYVCYTSVVAPDEVSVTDLPSSDVLQNYQIRWRSTARNGPAYDFSHAASASAIRVATSIIEAGVTNQIQRLFPAANVSQLVRRRLTWAARDLAVLFQCTGIPYVLMDGIQSDAVYNDHMRFTSGLTSQVPRALMRSSNNTPAWTAEQLFNALRNFMFGNEQAQLWLPDFHQPADIEEDHFPVNGGGHSPYIRNAPRPLHFANALNNLQAIAWYLQTIFKTLTAQLSQYRYRVSLRIVSQRFKTAEEVLILQERGAIVEDNGQWTYHFFSVHHTFEGVESASAISHRLLLAILQSLYSEGQLKYGDESDILPLIRGIAIIPVQLFNSRAFPGLRVPPEVRFHPHAARRIPVGLFNADPRVNFYNDSRGLVPREPITMRDSEVEAIAHTRQWIIDWLSQSHAHSLKSLPPQFQEIVETYEIKHGFGTPYDHQCLSNCLLFVGVASTRLHAFQEKLLAVVDNSLSVSTGLLHPSFSDEDAFVPTNATIDRLHRKVLTSHKKFQDESLGFERADFLDEVQKIRSKLLHNESPSAEVFMRGNILETTYTVFQNMDALQSVTFMFIRGFEGEASSYLLRISRSTTFVSGSNVPYSASFLTLEGLSSISDTHNENEPIVGILNGHAFLLSKHSAQVMAGDVILPSYGSRSIRYHLYNTALGDPTAKKYELKIPKGTSVGADYNATSSLVPLRETLMSGDGILIPPAHTHRSLCYDCETGHCDACNAIHAVVVCLGVNMMNIKTFFGLECPRSSQKGCITQMILYLQSIQHEDSTIILSAHYGARFDHWFLHRVLRALQIPFEVVLAGKRLQRIKFWNTITLDTFNIFPNTLDSVSSNFLTDARIKEILPPDYVNVGKYQAFPYRLLDSRYEMKDFPVSELETNDELWGSSNKKIPMIDGMDETWSISKKSCYYMQHFFPQFFEGGFLKLRLATETYCVEDVKLLTIITIMHFFLVCQTPQKNIIPNVIECMTAPSLAWKTFLTCYMDPSINPTGRPRGDNGYAGIQVLHPNGLRVKVDISMLLDQSILGGYTYSNCRRVDSPNGLMGVDRNSSYPGEMLKELPVSYLKRTMHEDAHLQSLIDQGLVKETDLVLLTYIDFRPMKVTQRTFTVNMMGSNVGVDYLPLYWFDPTTKDVKFNVRWVRELLPYLMYGADIRVKMVYHFQAAPLFREFATTTYAVRRLAKRNKDTLMDSLSKLLMNSSFGKTIEEVKSSFVDVSGEHVIQSILSKQAEIVGVNTINVETFNPQNPDEPLVRQILQLETVGRRYSSGELAPVGSCILAGARASLASIIYHLEDNFVDESFHPILSPQGDTDSAFFKKPNMSAPDAAEAWDEFSRIYLSETVLGAWKVEVSVDKGYMLCPGKKTYALIKQSEGAPDEIVKKAHKGAPEWLVKKQGIEYYRKLVYGVGTSVTIPTSFKLDKDQRMQHTSITRSLKSNNIARYWPSPEVDEWSQSFPTLDHFMCNVFTQKGQDPSVKIKPGWYSTLEQCAWEVSFDE